MLDAAILREAKEARDRLLDLQHEAERARADYHHAVRRLCAGGGSMREIAEALGLSHQRVHQIVDEGSAESFLRRVLGRRRGAASGAGWFERFTERARQVVVLAQEEARALGHEHVGTEHLLLGVLRVDDGLAARALNSLGITTEVVRREVERVVGRGADAPPGRMRFTPRAKKVLELALREARALEHNYIGTEHVLLALVREEEGVAFRILHDVGADAEKVRRAIVSMLAA